MERVELKEKAKEKIKGNLWYLWKPLVFFELIVFLIVFLIVLPLVIAEVDENTINLITNIVTSVFSIIETVFMVGYAKYTLDFVRGKKQDWKAPFSFIKDHFIAVILLSLLVDLIILGGTILLIVPGIIFAIGHTFYQEVYVDNEDLKTMEVVKKSWNLTKGYKMDIFILTLSFIGWGILGVFTLGILYIWLIPYMNVTLLLFYEGLTKKDKVRKEEPVNNEKIATKEEKTKKTNKKRKKNKN